MRARDDRGSVGRTSVAVRGCATRGAPRADAWLRVVGLAVVWLAWTGLGLVRPAAAQEGPIVTRTDAGYTVDAYETNIVELLSQVGEHAGFTVQAPDSFSSSITLEMRDAPLDQILHRVLRNENYIIVYRGGVQKKTISGEGIEKIFLLSQASGQGPKVVAAPGVSPLAGPGAQPRVPAQPAAPSQPGEDPRTAAQSPSLLNPRDAELARRAAEARALAEARRAAQGQSLIPQPLAPAPQASAPGAARMVEEPGDFTPPDTTGGDIGTVSDPHIQMGAEVAPEGVPQNGVGSEPHEEYVEDY